jgi:hypothetical protein
MADPNDIARRFFEALLNQSIEGEFDAGYVWTYMPRVLQMADENLPLPPTCVAVLGELSPTVGLKAGAPLPDVMQAIERTFGECPFGREELLKLARYLREQRNGAFSTVPKKKGPSIAGEF